jgi:hypothetical protein
MLISTSGTYSWGRAYSSRKYYKFSLRFLSMRDHFRCLRNLNSGTNQVFAWLSLSDHLNTRSFGHSCLLICNSHQEFVMIFSCKMGTKRSFALSSLRCYCNDGEILFSHFLQYNLWSPNENNVLFAHTKNENNVFHMLTCLYNSEKLVPHQLVGRLPLFSGKSRTWYIFLQK